MIFLFLKQSSHHEHALQRTAMSFRRQLTIMRLASGQAANTHTHKHTPRTHKSLFPYKQVFSSSKAVDGTKMNHQIEVQIGSQLDSDKIYLFYETHELPKLDLKKTYS